MNSDKKMINYFKKWDGMGPLGIGMLAVGFLLLWLGMSYFSYILSILLFILGAGAFIYGNIGRGNVEQIDVSIKKHLETLLFPELEEDFALHKRTPKNTEELTFEGFEMRNGLYFKKKKDASVISSEYTCIKMMVLKDAFYLKRCTFSFVSDEKTYETVEIPFDAIQSIEPVRNTLMVGHGKKAEYRVKTCHIAITYGDGKQVLLPKTDDAYVDDLVYDLKKKCGK